MCPRRSASPSQISRSKRIACRQCRQGKVRCQLSTEGAIPCTRCRRMGHDCKLDTAFQRVNRREKIKALEEEIQYLRSSVAIHSVDPGSQCNGMPPGDRAAIAETLSGNNEPSGGGAASLYPVYSNVSSQPCLATSSSRMERPNCSSRAPSATTPRTMESITLSGSQIDTFFQIFFEHYHPYLPLLDSTVTPDAYHMRSPLLFWVIVLLASRQYTDEPSFLVSLSTPVKRLLWDEISRPPHTWSLVQSILLMAFWPLPTSSLSLDNTPVLVSIAHTIATKLGLHRPESIQDFSRTKRRLGREEMAEAARIWATCYNAIQSVVAIDGQAGISSDWMIDELCDRDAFGIVPTAMKHQLLLSRFSAKVCHFMSSNPDTPTGLPKPGEGISLLALLEREFIELRSSLAHQLSNSNQVILHGVELQLYVFYLLNNSESDSRERGLLRAYHSASEVISILSDMEATSQAMKYSPIQLFRIISMAALFILKLTYSNLRTLVDTEGGRRAFNTAVSLIRRASIEDNDIQGRMSTILTQLWSVQSRTGQCDQKPELKLRTRLSSSLIHDSLWAWREQFSAPRIPESTSPIGIRSSGLSPMEIPTANSPDDSTFTELTLESVIDSELLSLLPFTLNGIDI